MTASTIDPQRHQQLLAIKLRALVRDHVGADVDSAPEPIGIGAALVHGDTAWVLADADPGRALGPALAWAWRRHAGRVAILAEEATGTLARRAGGFAAPIEVWHVEGRTLLPAVAEPLAAEPDADPAHLALVELIAAGGADPVVEHGVVSGEVAGLEVCRVVDDRWRGVVRLEVGVGAHDREAFQMLHGDVPAPQALVEVVDAVATHRRGTDIGRSSTHPLGRLAVERWWRWYAGEYPELVGAAAVVPAAPPVARRNVKDPVPCVATGCNGDAGDRRLVFSAGVDLDLVPFAVDVQAGTTDPVALVVPQRDLLPIQQLLADRLVVPVTYVTV